MPNRGKERQRISRSFDAVLFDLDGTLTDPVEGITNSYLHALEKLGLHESDPGKIKTFMGASLHLYFKTEHDIDDAKMEEAVAAYREYFSARGLYENKLYEGISELLITAHEKGINLFLATSKPTVYAGKILEYFELGIYFKNIYGSELTVQNRSKGSLIREAIKNENLHGQRVLMVGDREFDVLGARENGISSAAVSYGYGPISELIKSEPDYIVTSVLELRELLLNEKHK